MASNHLDKKPVPVWGVPFIPLTHDETLEAVSELVERSRPSFFITANTHYVMLAHEMPELQEVNERATFIVADGAPLVWASRKSPVRLPERVAGSDLIFSLSGLAAEKGYRVYLAGGSPGVAEEAARNLIARNPKLQIVGTEAPYFRNLTPEEYAQFKARVQKANPHLLFIAATMPQGEIWLSAHHADLGVPVNVNLGASFDFAAGRIDRAPRWMQKTGLEWAFRLMLEPKRLYSRYARNAGFILSMLLRKPKTSSSN